MPEELYPNPIPQVDLDGPDTPWFFGPEAMGNDAAVQLVSQTFDRLQQHRSQNADQRWRLNEWLYYGYVPPRTWDGTTIPRSSLPVQISYAQVESAHAKLCAALLSNEEILGVTPEALTTPDEAGQIKDRLNYILDHDIDDFGWNARLELKLCIRDMLIYGNCFGLVEWDENRKQATVLRVDPRDVYMDPGCSSPYIERSRNHLLRKLLTVDELDAMRDIPGINVPPRPILNYLAQNRDTLYSDSTKSVQEMARGYRYAPVADDWLPLPASRFIEVLIYQGGGREIWTLNRKWAMINIVSPYDCYRTVSAPCSPVPNRFYAQSFVDILDPIQQASQALLNRHMDEMALALSPPRATKRGVIRTPSSMSWRPGLVNEYDNPKDDVVVFQPQGITQSVFQDLGYLQGQAEMITGQNSLSSSGTPRPGNANRTKGGMAMQLQAPAERLGAIAANFEEFFLVPMLYKMLRVEKVHAEGDVYAKRKGGRQQTPRVGTAEASSGAGTALRTLLAMAGKR